MADKNEAQTKAVAQPTPWKDEIEALEVVTREFASVDPDARDRMFRYIASRFNLSLPSY